MIFSIGYWSVRWNCFSLAPVFSKKLFRFFALFHVDLFHMMKLELQKRRMLFNSKHYVTSRSVAAEVAHASSEPVRCVSQINKYLLCRSWRQTSSEVNRKYIKTWRKRSPAIREVFWYIRHLLIVFAASHVGRNFFIYFWPPKSSQNKGSSSNAVLMPNFFVLKPWYRLTLFMVVFSFKSPNTSQNIFESHTSWFVAFWQYLWRPSTPKWLIDMPPRQSSMHDSLSSSFA